MNLLHFVIMENHQVVYYIIYPLSVLNRALCTEVSICSPGDDLWLSICFSLFLPSFSPFVSVTQAPKVPDNPLQEGKRNMDLSSNFGLLYEDGKVAE